MELRAFRHCPGHGRAACQSALQIMFAGERSSQVRPYSHTQARPLCSDAVCLVLKFANGGGPASFVKVGVSPVLRGFPQWSLHLTRSVCGNRYSIFQAAFFLVSLFLASCPNLSIGWRVSRVLLFQIASVQSYPQAAVFSYRTAKGFYL
jgi:hypothetical protein